MRHVINLCVGNWNKRLATVGLLLSVLVFQASTCWAQSDIEVTDSTSSVWGGGIGGGGLNPQLPNEPVTSLTISQTTLTLEGGESVRLTATVNPKAGNKTILWSSTNAEIAYVDASGRVIGLAAGTASIVATAAGNTSLTQTCQVTVTSDYVLPESGWILPWGKVDEWTMKYLYFEQADFQEPPYDDAGRNWKQLGYDDSQWSTLTGPMGSSGVSYSTYNYQWNGEYNCFCLRSVFYMPTVDDETVYTFLTQHDDGILVFINGMLIAEENTWTDDRVSSFDIPASILKKGENQLAIFIKQNYGGAFLDYAIRHKTPHPAKYMPLPNVPFEFYYNAQDYDETDMSIPNQQRANLATTSLVLSGSQPTLVAGGEALRFSDRCEGYLDKWGKGSTASGNYFFREGQDCMTIVAKVAPKLDTGNACDFVSNRDGGYNYMWRIGDHNSSFLHTGAAYGDDRSLPIASEEPQILAVRVDGPNDYILLQNLTTGEKKRIDGVYWGGGGNVFKLFYNDGGEYFLGDFYWIYYSFELLTDAQLKVLDGTIQVDDTATITAKSYTRVYGAENPTFEYEVEGAALEGKPEISCEATAKSPVGTYEIVVKQGSVMNNNVTYVKGTLTIEPAPLTIKVGNYTKKQGEPMPEFAVSYEGFVNGETNAVLSKQPTVSCEATEASVPGEYAITVSGAEAQNYTISYAAGKLIVTEADAVAIIAKDYTRKYGEENPTFDYDVSGAALDGKPEISCEATATSPVGTYEIVVKQGNVSNYNVTYVKGTLTIEPAPLTIKADTCTKKQGDPMPEFAVSYDGFVNGETETVLTKQPSINCEADENSQPGVYAITVSGAEAQNYAINYVAGKLTVLEPDEITDVAGQSPNIVRIYSVGGKPRKALQKGVNIVVLSNGTKHKIVVK